MAYKALITLNPKKETKTYNTTYTPTAAPTISQMPTAPQYENQTWDESTKGRSALDAYGSAKDAVNNYGHFTFSENEWLTNIKDSIKNYGNFSYDVNSDALYQQYADQYARMGKMAMQDTMGQAAAMTGGYGNSYAASVGNQAYQSYIQQLNDKVPELYQLALNRYNMGKEDLYNQYGMLLSEYEREYGLYSDEYNKLLDTLGIAKDDYYNGADMFYNEQNNTNNLLGQEFNDAMSIWDAENQNAWKQAEWEEGLKQYANDEIWRQKEYDLNDRQVTLQEKAYEDSSQDTAKLYSGTAPKGGNYNNGSLTTGQVKELQAVLGVSADGYYGEKSKKAAGGLSAAEAYAKYVGGNSGGPETKEIPNTIRQTAGTFTNNDALNDYLTKQRDAGLIDDEQMGQLYLEYEVPSLSNRNWITGENGGINWFGGIDNNATVKDQYGNEYRMDKLVDALVAEGMDKKSAKEYVKKLQDKLGM